MYSVNDQPYCEEHYADKFLPKCSTCARPVADDGVKLGSGWVIVGGDVCHLV